MKYRNNLLFIALAGAGLATVCWLAFTSRNTAELAGSAHAKSEQNLPLGQTAKKASPVGEEGLQIADEASWRKAKPSADESARHAKPVQTSRLSKRPQPQRQPKAAMASNSTLPPEAAAKQPANAPQEAEAGLPVRPVSPQEARNALKEVGTNIEAESVWMAAISDPNMPAGQRKDLIEDLNEEGFADPKHLTAADLPRIENRLALIEELAPDAMDQTNADAFEEAYKDLTNMYNRLAAP